LIKSTVGATGTALTDQTWLTLDGLPDAPLYTEALDKPLAFGYLKSGFFYPRRVFN
jgi:hypothetical protein